MRQQKNTPSRLDAVKILGKPPTVPIPIRIDTREQHPLRFDPAYAIATKATVKIFDYAIDGDEGWAIERKSTQDLIQSFTVGKEGELRKISKARQSFDQGWPLIYVVEGGTNQLLKFSWNRFKRATPQWFFSTLSDAMTEQRISFVFCQGRQETAMWIYRLLKTRWKHLQKN